MRTAIRRAELQFGLCLALGLTLAGCGGSRDAASGAGAAAPTAGYFTVPDQQLSHLQLVPATTTTWPVSRSRRMLASSMARMRALA